MTLLAAIVAALGLIATGCGGDGDDAGSAAGGTTTAHEQMETSASASGGSISSPAVDTRVALDRLLGEHAMLAMFATQKGLGGEKDFDAIAAALDANSRDLAEVVGSVYGDAAAKKFLDGGLLWRFHIKQFVAYTQGLAKGDEAAKKAAVNRLRGYVEAQSAFFSDATGLDQAAARTALTEHVGQLKGQLDRHAAKDYAGAYETFRAAYAHMFMTGDALADAIATQQSLDAGDVSQGAADLRVALGRLLGEHAMLAMVATQKGYAGSPDFEAIAGALDANSRDLAAAVGSVYGDSAAKKFLDGQLFWRFHIEQFVAYTGALAKKDKAAQEEAVNKLKGYVEAQSGFFADATGAPQDGFRDALTQHVTQLKGQIDAYAAGDYEEAYRLAREAYAHMYMTGDALAGAIVAQGSAGSGKVS